MLIDKKNIVALYSFIVFIFLIATYERNILWQSESSLWSDVRQKSENNWKSYFYLGKYFWLKDDVVTARSLFVDGLSRTDNNFGDSKISFALANSYLEEKKYDKAKTYYLRTLQFDPNNSKAMVNLASCYLNRGDSNKAISLYEQAVKTNFNTYEAHLNLGLIAWSSSESGNDEINRQNRVKALGHFYDARSVFPDNIRTYYSVPRVYLSLGKLEDAAGDITLGLKLFPDNQDLAVLYMTIQREISINAKTAQKPLN